MKKNMETAYNFPKPDFKQVNGVYYEPFSKKFKITINDGKYVNTEDYSAALQFTDEGDVEIVEDGQIILQTKKTESVVNGKKEVEDSDSEHTIGFFYNNEILEAVNDVEMLADGTLEFRIPLYDKSVLVYSLKNGTAIRDKVTKKLLSKKHDKKELQYKQTLDHIIVDDEEDGIVFFKYGQDYFQVIYKKEQ